MMQQLTASDLTQAGCCLVDTRIPRGKLLNPAEPHFPKLDKENHNTCRVAKRIRDYSFSSKQNFYCKTPIIQALNLTETFVK